MTLSYPYVCSSQAEVPEEALSYIDKGILEGVGGAFSEIFPLFARVFDRASWTIDSRWSAPKLVIKKGMREWVSYLAVQRDEKNLFFFASARICRKGRGVVR
ncbi:hypothetical protein [Microbulbifer sp. JSM ZJ756]|uniref:hypothetical protein n=1 Tax=Microbulbifer sp. JSM ZJ756 TaxID=3376191 RepID=UPI00378E25FA